MTGNEHLAIDDKSRSIHTQLQYIWHLLLFFEYHLPSSIALYGLLSVILTCDIVMPI